MNIIQNFIICGQVVQQFHYPGIASMFGDDECHLIFIQNTSMTELMDLCISKIKNTLYIVCKLSIRSMYDVL